jgi:tetratricopeptide (TPR) repeat protein
LVLLLQTILFSCSGLRTEIYREETRHRYNQACKFYKQGDYQTARSELETIIGLDPDYGPAHAALGNLALIGEDYSGALIHYQAAVAVDPELEAELRRLIMVARAHKEREPLQKAGVGLDQVYPLIMADRTAEVEALLDQDIPLQLLANDSMGITPGKLGELQHKIAETADPLMGSVRYRLFVGYLLFFGHIDDALATAMIQSVFDEVSGRDRQEAWVILGQLHERRGKANEGVDAYLAAVDAGLPMTDVAHHLARVYRVDIETILPSKAAPAEDAASQEPMRIEMATHLPPSPAPDLGSAADAKNIHLIERRGSQYTF